MGQDLVPLLQPLLGGAQAVGASGSNLHLFAESLAEEDKIRSALSGVADLGRVEIGGDLDSPPGCSIAFQMGGEQVTVTVWSVGYLERIFADLASLRPLADPHGLIARWQAGGDPGAPEMVVERQLAAYNAHDLEAFLATYAQDIQLERGDEVFVGLEAMRVRYGPIFAAGRCHAVIGARMRQGDWVVDRETAYGLGPEPVRVLVAYRVRGGVIDRVRFMA